MYGLTHNNNKAVYGIKRFILDKEEDTKTLPTRGLTPGSTAFVIGTSNTYMLNNLYVWKKVKANNSSSGGTGPAPDPSDNTYVWDGGDIG